MKQIDAKLHKGFALILTMALLSFLLLLVATLATSLRIETQSSFNKTNWNQARQNALMGMNIALGQLQELAGPDQRVTATGGILSEKYNLPKGNEYWTGVWNASNGNFEGWLVSDSMESTAEGIITQVAPTPNEDGSSVWMVNHSVDSGSDQDESRRVAIRKQPIRSTGIPGFSETERITVGNYSYWISDEGVKASALKTDTPLPEELSNLAKTRMRQLANRKTDLKELYNQVDVKEEETDNRLKLSFSFKQLEAVDGISREGLAEYFHELTPVSLGVMSNTLDGPSGGLRQDLSQPINVSNGSIPVNDAIIQFLNHRPYSNDNLDLQVPMGGDSSPEFSIFPVTTEFALRIGFGVSENGSGPLRIYVALRADLWNPYSLPINSNPRDEADFLVQMEGLPELTIHYVTQTGNEPEQLRETFSLNLGTPEYEEQIIDLFSRMEPGQVRNVYHSHINPNIFDYVDATPTDITDDKLIIEAPNSTLNIKVTTPAGEILQSFSEISFDELLTEAAPINKLEYDPTDPENIYDNEMPLRYWFRFYNEVDVISPSGFNDIERWSNELDPRTSNFNFNDSQTLLFIEYDPDVYSGYRVDDFNSRPEFFYGAGRGRSGLGNFHRFFDLPTVEPISIAALRHINLPTSGPNFLGNSSAVVENQVFDEWYFSTLPKTPSDIQNRIDEAEGFYKRPFINPHISLAGEPVIQDLQNPQKISQNIFNFGAFNINSTSADTWELVLLGNSLQNWEYRIDMGPGSLFRNELKNPFYRLPFGADRHYTYPISKAGTPDAYDKTWWKTYWDPDWATSYTVGVREFTDEDITTLAEKIVEVIKEQQTPSRSIADFLNKGILQQAIDRTDINTINGAEYRYASRENRIPLNAPAFLNQADILNTIAPFIQARSDTFRIRAYGDAINPVTGKLEGRAWCEAWVQRYPELVDETADVSASANGFGRKFKIVHFKWLDESQI